jgi:CheY-specific phosphatase CheX
VKTQLAIDDTIMNCIAVGTIEGLAMTGIVPPPVGASKFFTANRKISVMVGLVGKSNGTLTINMSERGMLHMAGKLLMEDLAEPNEDSFDAICEIGNMVAGCVKEHLAQTDYNVTNISVPSLILGANYNVYYSRGIETVSVEFELEEIPAVYQSDRFFSVTTSLLRQIA